LAFNAEYLAIKAQIAVVNPIKLFASPITRFKG